MTTSLHADRRQRLRRLLRTSGVDGFLVTNPANVTYLSAFTGDSSYLLLTAHDAVMLSDGRYTQQLSEECPELPVQLRSTGSDMLAVVARAVRTTKIGSLAIEAASTNVAFWVELEKQLPMLELVLGPPLVEQLREIKDRHEIAQIKAAIELAERAFAVVRAGLRRASTEQHIAAELEYQIRLFGGRGCSFTPIVAAGPRSALPHARLSARQIGESDFVLIDWGACGDLYVSDLTRILVIGRISPKFERIYDVVLQAQQAAIDAIRPGAILEDIDAAARRIIEAAGFGERFTHAVGHGIGLEIHEQPRVAPGQRGALKPGMVVTVEPGIYLPRWGGIRIEDDVLVTRTGCEVLTKVPKQLADCVVR